MIRSSFLSANACVNCCDATRRISPKKNSRFGLYSISISATPTPPLFPPLFRRQETFSPPPLFWDNCSATAISEVELWCRPSLHSFHTVSLSLSTGKKKKKEEVKVRLFPPSSAAAERAASSSFHPSSHSLFHFPSSLFFLSFFPPPFPLSLKTVMTAK